MMKRMLWVVPLLLVLCSTVADAQSANPDRRRRGERHAPEFDPKASGAAVALLIGDTLLLSERRRRNNSESN
jgi:hypothetical protein